MSSPAEMAKLVRRMEALLATGPRKASEIAEAFGTGATELNGVGLWLDLVRVPPSGTWDRRRADLYDTSANWLGEPRSADPDPGVDLLIRRYLGAFGPAQVKDIADWAGLPVTAIKSAAERLAPKRYRDEQGRELVDVARAPLPSADTPAPVRFIPVWDAILLAHARRTQVLPERFRALVFNTKTPHSLNTFLVDGRVAGSWTYESGRVKVQPFEPLPRAAKRELDEQASELAAFMS